MNRDAYKRYRWVASQARSSEFFLGGIFPDFYFLLDLRNPGPVPLMTPFEYTSPDEVREILAGLEKVLWGAGLDLTDNAKGDHLGALRAYIRNHYHVTREFPEYEVWVRSE